MQIENTLYNAFGSKQISTIYTPSNQYKVILEVEPQFQFGTHSALSNLYLRSLTTDQLVPLNTVADLTLNTGPLTVNHTGQLPSITISFNTKPDVVLGQAVEQVEQAMRDIRLPVTINTNFQGTAQQFQSSMKGLYVLLIMAILVIYIVLGILYESFIHPLTILSGLPAAGAGALDNPARLQHRLERLCLSSVSSCSSVLSKRMRS